MMCKTDVFLDATMTMCTLRNPGSRGGTRKQAEIEIVRALATERGRPFKLIISQGSSLSSVRFQCTWTTSDLCSSLSQSF